VQPVRGGGVGDLLCRAVIETPVNLNKQQKDLLRELQESLGEGGQATAPGRRAGLKA
jgi:molecular chaperone DnaJ